MSGFDQDVAAEAQRQEAAEADRLRAKLKRRDAELGQVRRTLVDVESECDTLRRVAEFSALPLKPPTWLTRAPKKADKVVTLATILSDLHLDEVVDPHEVNGLNAYNRVIAEARLERYFAGIVKLARHYWTGVAYTGIVCMLAGDMMSGEIHDELTQSNEDTTLGTVLYWTERIAAGLSLLADEFGAVHCVVVVGNHGRRTRKPRAKKRARDNFDWLMGQMLARYFKDDERVTFDIPDGTDSLITIHDTAFLLTHGDQVGGGGGIGGIWPPLMRMIARKRTRYEFDSLVCGHWHQLIMAPTAGLIVNGSLKGFDEFAAVMNFVPEPPQQALWTVAPERGVTFSAPVFVMDRKTEGW